MSHKSNNGQLRGLPHSRGCFVCGEANSEGFRGRFEVDGKHHVYFRFKPRDSMQGYGTVMHGGLQATLLDETMGWAAAVAVRRMTLAAEMTFRYLQKTPLGEDLIVEAWATEVKSRLVKAEGIIRDDAGTIYTRGFGKFAPLTVEETRFVDSHLIYHDGDLRIFEGV
jgi:acyl-coenzyme A thioesterase PaaI-like protein